MNLKTFNVKKKTKLKITNKFVINKRTLSAKIFKITKITLN